MAAAVAEEASPVVEAVSEPVSVPESPAPAPEPAPVVTTPAGWYPDPSTRYELRYWDGSAWTEHVARPGPAVHRPSHPLTARR